MNTKQNDMLKNKIVVLVTVAITLLTILTTSCGKNEVVKKNQVENTALQTEAFAEQFFYNCNFPYQKLQSSEIQNGSEEYLFYIPNGAVYRTWNDYAVVIVARCDIHENETQAATNYSGDLYQIFEDDEADLLKICAAGDYAMMAHPSTIPNWEEDDVVTAFIKYASNYKDK